MFCESVSWSNGRPSIFMVLSVGSGVLFIVSLSVVECSAGVGVNSIVYVFERVRITGSHRYISPTYLLISRCVSSFYLY